MKIICAGIVYILFLNTGIFANESFYAISSLRSFLDADPESNRNTITFDDSEIALLWETAAAEPLSAALVEDAWSFYYSDSENRISLASAALEKAWISLENSFKEEPFIARAYPNFDDNPYLDKTMRQMLRSFLLPLDHPVKSALDGIFKQSRAVENDETLKNSGFVILEKMSRSHVRIALHPSMPGYIFKIYPDCEQRKREGLPGWKWLKNRCEGANNICKLIQREKLVHFIVPDKWLYPIPSKPKPILEPGQRPQPVLLIATFIPLVSRGECELAWKTKVTLDHLKELYCILSHGYASTCLPANIPYTANNKFACIDTEYPARQIKYDNVKEYLCPEMCSFWDKLVKSGGKIK